jgi:Ankyrin repeats (3 copies)
MNDVIDMTMADPFCGNAKDGGPSLPFVNPAIASGAPVGIVGTVPLGPTTCTSLMRHVVSTPVFSSAMEAFAATKQLHAHSLSQHKRAHNNHQNGLHSLVTATAAESDDEDFDDDDDDDQTMSTTSSQSMYDDDRSRSSWSESSEDDSEGDGNEDYTMYAPVAGASRGHLLRPMSLQQITALAVATGARKPCALPQHQQLASLSSGNLQQGVVTFGTGGAVVVNNTHRSASMPSLTPQITHYQQMTAGTTAVDPSTGKAVTHPALAVTRPDDRLLELLQELGKSMDYSSYSEIQDYFLKVQPKHIEAFQQETISAVRGKSVDTLRAMFQQGKMLQCCNKFGESIVHMACRQSSAQVLEFLIREAGVTVRVCCDSGRTPLHDACWTSSPDFDIIALLLTECPDFLRVKDKRGFSPLAYVPHAQWNRWGQFLEQNKHLLEFKGFA